jgi:hypothetical protein
MENQEILGTPKTLWADRSEGIMKIGAALSKFQGKIQPVIKDATNPFFKSNYANLATIWAAIREQLAANEMAILQEPSTLSGRLVMTTTLIHSSGEYFRSSVEFPILKNDAQGIGSAITYARRYALQSITGIAPEDDDGNAASGKQQDNKQPAKQPIAPVQAKTLEKKQKLTIEAIAAKKAYQYDAVKMGGLYPSEEEKAAAWKAAVRDYGAIAENGHIYTLSPVSDWYEFWLNEYEHDNLPESFGENLKGVSQ